MGTSLEDIRRVTELRIADPRSSATHFLGAVVLQSHEAQSRRLTTWNVIDGQQRLTTLQILADATCAVLTEAGEVRLAGQLESRSRRAHLETPNASVEQSEEIQRQHAEEERLDALLEPLLRVLQEESLSADPGSEAAKARDAARRYILHYEEEAEKAGNIIKRRMIHIELE